MIASETGADLGEGCRGCAPLPPEMTCRFLINRYFANKKGKKLWFIGVEVKHKMMLRNLCGVPCKWYVFSAVRHDYLVTSLLLHSSLAKFVCHPPVRSFLTGTPPHDENPGSASVQ